MVTFIAFIENPAPPWWDYPGLELWKFFNLGIFILGLLYFVKQPLGEAFRGRQEAIRRELAKARQDRDEALAKLQAMDDRLKGLDSEVAALQQQSRLQAEAERERIARETEKEIAMLREQAQREIESAGKVARLELRKFAAYQIVTHAEEVIRRELRPDDDARLIQVSVEQLGGTKL
jgi:F0F1-type ATP synthase membrane subunit b/b'